MLIIPAIDLKMGKVVRLIQGRQGTETIYATDPGQIALKWQKEGAKMLHVVDLDGAFIGSPQNLPQLKAILEVISIPVQMGGGVRDLKIIEKLLNMGVERVVIGTKIVTDSIFIEEAVKSFENHIVAGIDARAGKVVIEGWITPTVYSVTEMAKQIESYGISELVFTDTSKDGMLKGPNFSAIEEISQTVSIEVIASGGISTMEDIKRLKAFNISGIIVGKALYTGEVGLKEAINYYGSRF